VCCTLRYFFSGGWSEVNVVHSQCTVLDTRPALITKWQSHSFGTRGDVYSSLAHLKGHGRLLSAITDV